MFNKIDKYGVPISSDNDTRRGLSQPKFTSRFRVLFENFGLIKENTSTEDDGDNASSKVKEQMEDLTVLTSMVESFTRPTLNFNNQEATSFMGRSKYSGRIRHENFTLVLRDDINNNIISKVYAQAKKQAYKFHPVTSFGGLQKSPYLGIDTKFTCKLQIMDGRTNHKALETWTFNGCIIDSIDTSAYSYDDAAAISKITLQCSFDYFDVSQESRLILPSSYAYDEFAPSSGSSSSGDETDSGGLFDDISDSASDIGGSVLDNVNGINNGPLSDFQEGTSLGTGGMEGAIAESGFNDELMNRSQNTGVSPESIKSDIFGRR